MLKDYPDGYDLSILNTMYRRSRKLDNGKYSKDSMTIVYKDNQTNLKRIEYIEEPDYEFYIAKEGVDCSYNRLFIEEEKVEPVVTPYVDLEKTIAELTSNTQFFYDNIRNGNRYNNKVLHANTRVFNSDMEIEDHYRYRFSKKFTNNISSISKAYFDIEADTINMMGDFPEMGECPINAITIIFQDKNLVFTFLLRNPDNPLIEEFERGLSNDTFIELKDLVRDTVGGWKNEIRYGLDKFEYKMFFYDEEIQLIHDLFLSINKFKPDFCLAWNMAFDIPYIIERIKNLGYSPEEIMCHPDFKEKVAEYFIDELHKNEIEERGDYASISSYSVFLDQMIHYASRRKGQRALPSYSLDYIGGLVAKVRKLDYSHITTNIAKFPWLNYKLFVFYNIIDTIVQYCVEKKTGDIDYVYSKSLLTNTRYQKVHRQTIYLTNLGTKKFSEDHFIIGNNITKFKERPEGKYPGAFVADPNLINDYAKMQIYGKPVMLFNNLDDFDYKSLYPSLTREFNIAPHTQIGLIEIPNADIEKLNKYRFEYYTSGSGFCEDFVSRNFIEFGHRWLFLGNFNELYDDIVYYFTNVINSARYLYINEPNKPIVRFINNDIDKPLVTFNNVDGKRLILFNKPRDIRYNEIIKGCNQYDITK